MYRLLKNLKSVDVSTSFKRHPILLACLSSGILYQSYRTLPRHKDVICQTNKIFKPHVYNQTFLSNNSNKSGDVINQLRMNRLLDLHRVIETELPIFFDTNTFEFSEKLFDPDTIVYFENSNGLVYTLRYVYAVYFGI